MTWKILPTFVLGVFITGTVLADAEPGELATDAALSNVGPNQPVTGENVPSAESITVPSSKASEQYGHKVSRLLVSCMDFRLRDEVKKFMELRFGLDQYDEYTIPGASLGSFNGEYPHWQKTFEDVVTLAVKLHGVTHVIFLDHRSCGFYEALKGPHCCDDKAEETHVHAIQFEAVRKIMKEKFPQIEVETLLMGLDGQVETIRPEKVS